MSKRFLSKRLRPNYSTRRSTSGFTLIEVLVVVIIIGILFAIAAPGWEAILSRQRVSSVREQVGQLLRQTQIEARNSRSPRAIVFDNNSDVPRYATVAYRSDLALDTLTNWQEFGNGGLQPRTVRLSTNRTTGSLANAIVFDSNGAVAQPPNVVSIAQVTQTTPFIVTVEKAATPAIVGTKRCIVIRQLLGAPQLADGARCNP